MFCVSLTGQAQDLTYQNLHGTLDGGGSTVSDGRFRFDGSINGLAGVVLTAGGYRNQTGHAGLLNEPPLARNDAVERPAGSSFKLRAAKVLANDFDAEGNPLTFSLQGGASDNGGSASLLEGWILYAPPEGSLANENDRLHYQVRDGSGAAGQGVISVVVAEDAGEAGGEAPPNLFRSRRIDDQLSLTFVGMPGEVYKLQFRESLDEDSLWEDYPEPGNPFTATASLSGGFYRFTFDFPETGTQGFFRAIRAEL